MVGTRWQRSLLACLGLFLMGHVALAADDALPDLRLSDLTLVPSASIVRGSLLHVGSLLTLDGAPLNGNIRVEISWRRLDKQEPCGTTWDTVASDSADWETSVEAWIDTSELIPGEYELVVSVDPENWIPESDETNNRLITSLTIRSPQPELHLVRLESIPAIPLAWGETATLKTEIENSGDLAAGAFHVEFSLLPISCTDTDTGEQWDISVIVGQSETGDIGDWDFDQTSGIRTLSEAVAAAPSDAWIPFAMQQVPGLARDQNVELTGVFGTGESLREILTTGVQDGTLESSIMTPFSTEEMARLENCVTTYAIRVSITELTGTQEQDAANNDLTIALSVAPSVLELPELLPVFVTFDEDLPLAWDDDVDVDVVVSNRGGSSAPKILGSTSITVSFSYRVQGATVWIPLEVKTISQLGAEDDSATDSVSITIDARPSQLNLAPGSYELRVIVDEANRIAERNEHNNELIVGFSIRGTELHPVSLDLPAEAIHQGDTIAVSALVENTGDRSQRDFTVGFYIDDTRFDTFTYQAIAATEDGLEEDDRARVQGILDTTDLPPETYAIRVVVDPDNHILEYDEGNNVIQATLRLFPPVERLAELHITEIGFEPVSPIPAGSSLQVSAAIRNDGTISAGTFDVTFDFTYSADGQAWSTPILDMSIISDTSSALPFEKSQSIQGLARAEKKTVRETFATLGWPIGFYRLVVAIDPRTESAQGGAVAEMDDLNNEAVIGFMIGEPIEVAQDGGQTLDLPNLLFRDVAVKPSTSVGLGAPVSIEASIVNAGTRPSGTFLATLQWTTPTGASYTLFSRRVSNLDPGETWIIPPSIVQTSLPMGPYVVIGILDAGNEVPESSESDNELRVAVSVGQGEGIQPDLTPIAVRFVPSTAIVEAGQEVLIYTTIQNIGALAAGPFAVEVVAGDAVSRETWPRLEPLQSIELVHSLGAPVAGAYEVLIQVDAYDQVVESNESNNLRIESLQIVASEQDAVERVMQGQGPLASLALDSSTGTLYAAWQTGVLRAADRNGGQRLIYSGNMDITQMVTVFGVQDVAYLGSADGRILSLDLATGDLLTESQAMNGGVVDLVLGDGNALYVATSSQLFKLDVGLSILTQVSLVGALIDLDFETVHGSVYALTSTGLYAFDANLSPQCAVTDFAGTPSTLAIGESGVYVGTQAGILRALTFCQNISGVGMKILDTWRYPRTGSLGSAITSITVDERDVDPIYLAVENGSIHSLSFAGALQWTYQSNASGRLSIPSIDERSGRLFYADSTGTPTILSADGVPAFPVNSTLSHGSAATANTAIDEVRRQTASGMRLFRIYYFGADDGWVYKVESIR